MDSNGMPTDTVDNSKEEVIPTERGAFFVGRRLCGFEPFPNGKTPMEPILATLQMILVWKWKATALKPDPRLRLLVPIGCVGLN